ncbi:MAG TPA: glycine--tRNA ligase subunit beta [Candidatus Omnitrophota bacterium]|nr:glycine--tRNA ligase subunit beta [Candidatus Omnitrophota bacterium]HPS37005.1 glycine--tRNA ligase subunit beta [Candidatus Omnitrophota bacterium]
MPNLLVEVGVEELPVGSLDVIYDELAVKVRQKLVDERIAFAEVKVEATPRRIALFVQGIAAMQQDRTLEISGPFCEKCYDGAGKPTQVLQGFLRSKQATEKDIEVRESPKGKFIFLKKYEKGRPVIQLLPEFLKQILMTLSFPKFMRWESTGFRFPRPIRWLVVLLDQKRVPMVLADVRSGNKSFGHRFLAPQGFVIPKADWKLYLSLLKKKHVHLEIAAREALVRSALKTRFGQKQADEELLHMNAQLVEEPYFIKGAFSQEYLELPAEVLASCMKKNQKIFACCDAKGQMQNRFVAVMNGKRNGLPRIQADYENVLDSRLKDARYFYGMDTKEPFEKKKPVLAQLVYLGKLGSVLDKTERLEKLAGEFSEACGQQALSQDLARVASLSKIDLITHLVYEMPDLQGIVGREYAIEAKEKEAVALAIGAQYLPRSLGEDHQKVKNSMNFLGALFGIMDRLDLLVGAFGTGIEPTGSQDPFALRRAGGSIVKMIRAFDISFSLSGVIEADVRLYGGRLTKKDDLTSRLVKFLQERVAFELGVKPGTRQHEILQAVFRAGFDDLANVYDRYAVLCRMSEKDPGNFLRAAKVIQRTANMLKGYGKTPGEPRQDKLTEVQEKKLFELVQARIGDVETPIKAGDYEKATRLFAEIFSEPLNDFFDHVMVNAEDAEVRENRMALVARINRLYTGRLADLSVLSRIDEE